MTDLVSRVAQWFVPPLGKLEESRERGVSAVTAFRYAPFEATYSLFNSALWAGGVVFLAYASVKYPEAPLTDTALASWLLLASEGVGRRVSEAAVQAEQRAGWWQSVVERDADSKNSYVAIR